MISLIFQKDCGFMQCKKFKPIIVLKRNLMGKESKEKEAK
jgi:hypothetical protein